MSVKISIIMSVYEEDNSILSKCIQSMLDQSFRDFEFIIVNDGITDKNAETLNFFKENDKRIILLKNAANIGLTKSLNKALNISQGDYIARIDSDDFCDRFRLEKQYNFLKENDDYVICGTRSEEIKGEARKEQRSRFLTTDESIRKSLVFMNPFIHSSIMLKRKIIKEVNGYNEEFRYSQDYQMVYRISKFGKMKNLDECLVFRNVSENQISEKRAAEQLYYSIRTRIDILKDNSYGIKEKSILLLYLFRSMLKMVYLKVR